MPEKIEDKINNLLALLSEYGMFSGCVLVANKGHLIYNGAFGYANREIQKRTTSDSVFYIASVSKQLTAMSIMLLEHAGVLSFSDALSDFLPEFHTYAEKVTIEHLLTHTSGIPDHYVSGIYKPDLTNGHVVEFLLRQNKIDFEPGECFRYSNGGYVLLALIAEQVSGQKFHSLLKSQIFEPLGMSKTVVFDESKPAIRDRAIGYNADGALNDYEILTTGEGGVFSTVGDLFKWDRALHSEILIPTHKLKRAFSPHTLNHGKKSNYGYGWALKEYQNESLVSHGGRMSGYRSYIERNIHSENTIIILNNSSSFMTLEDLPAAIRRMLQNHSG